MSGARGTVYLLHIEPAYRHAGHYIGWTNGTTVDDRLARHLAGQGSPLIRAAVAAGHAVTVERTWPDATRDFERSLKCGGGQGHRHCPLCRPAHLARRRARAAAR